MHTPRLRPRTSPSEWWVRYRRVIAAAAVAIAVFSGLRAIAPTDTGAVTVLAPTTALAAGHVFADGDLKEMRLVGPSAQDPAGALTPGTAWKGRALALAWPAGLPLHAGALAGSELLRGLPAGEVAVPLPASENSGASLVSAGDRVDVVLTAGDESGGSTSVTVASGARVLWAGSRESAGGWLGSVSGSGQDRQLLVVVAVRRELAPSLSGASGRGTLSFVVVG